MNGETQAARHGLGRGVLAGRAVALERSPTGFRPRRSAAS